MTEFSIKALKGLSAELNEGELDVLVRESQSLQLQLRRDVPPESDIAERDLGALHANRECKLWAKDPDNGWICLEWE